MKRRLVVITVLVGVMLAALVGTAAQAQGPEGPGLIVYASDRTGNYEIYVLDPATGLTTQLTNDPGSDIEPVWSPDGDVIAFVSDRDGDFEVYVIRADGSDLRQLTSNIAEDRLPHWQPGGQYLIYSSDVNGQWDLYAISADGALVRQLTNDPGDERGPGFGAGGTAGVGPAVPTVAPAVVATPTPTGPDGIVDVSSLNVRDNPGPGATIITFVTRNAPLDIVGRYMDNTWLQVRLADGRLGWVAADYVRVNIDLFSVPVVNATFYAQPTATPTPTVVPTIIEFWADRTSIYTGQCVTLSWRVEGIREVYYEGIGVTGQGSHQECPTDATTTYVLRVILVDGSEVFRYITIVVNPTPTATPV
ncbi:MAG: PD40 domain-containing protein [Anaerolineae bacterium]|nr:PD40 domain-containing protein [Anaerolineae bacterium]